MSDWRLPCNRRRVPRPATAVSQHGAGPRSSGDRAPASGAGCAGSNPAGGADQSCARSYPSPRAVAGSAGTGVQAFRIWAAFPLQGRGTNGVKLRGPLVDTPARLVRVRVGDAAIPREVDAAGVPASAGRGLRALTALRRQLVVVATGPRLMVHSRRELQLVIQPRTMPAFTLRSSEGRLPALRI